MSTGLEFTEAMVGTWRKPGDTGDRLFRFDARVETPTLLSPFGTVVGDLTGTLIAEGLASGTPIMGTLEVSPLRNRRLHYSFTTVADDGHRYRFDGWKTIRGVHLLRAWTTLPGTLYDEDGDVVGTAITRFPYRTTPSFIAGFRLRHDDTGLEDRRWAGRPGRIEVWYDTLTDPRTGTGLWLHHELCAPSDGSAPSGYGWLALFPPDGSPELVRFGPAPLDQGQWFATGDVVAEPGHRSGNVEGATWKLTYKDDRPPLYTFPHAAWRHELLPSAQIVPAPTAAFRGTVTVGGRVLELEAAPGAAARIYGHGNAERWGWLHADLGDGDVLEVVAAVSRRPGLRRLPPLPFVRLRLDTVDQPRFGLLAALGGSAHLGLPDWDVTVRFGSRRLRVRVSQPADRCVAVEYHDPDGSPAICTNSERADADIVLEHRAAGGWVVERHWTLAGTAHAEIGTRP